MSYVIEYSTNFDDLTTSYWTDSETSISGEYFLERFNINNIDRREKRIIMQASIQNTETDQSVNAMTSGEGQEVPRIRGKIITKAFHLTRMGGWSTLLLLLLASPGLCSSGTEVDQIREVSKTQDVGSSSKLTLVTWLKQDLTALKSKVDSLESQLHLTDGKVDSGLQAMQQKTDAQLQAMQQKTDAQLQAMQQKTDAQLQAMQQKTDAQLQAMQQKVDAASGLLKTRVAFMTKVSAGHNVAAHTVVKLDSVQYNEGNGYNPATGIFTAPVAGMYTFFMKTEEEPDELAGLHMMKEGNGILYLYAQDSNSFETSSGQVVLHLSQGQRVWIQTTLESLIREWTRFGGFLVHPDL